MIKLKLLEESVRYKIVADSQILKLFNNWKIFNILKYKSMNNDLYQFEARKL
jgi:hypothetical protein